MLRRGQLSARAICTSAGAVAALGLLFTSSSSSYAEPKPAGETIGFAVSWFALAGNDDAADCTGGFTKSAVDEKELLKRIPEAVKKDFEGKQNRTYQLVTNRGPHGEDVCEDPHKTPDPGWKSVKTNAAPGLNLTASGAVKTCKHEKFATGTLGEANVDNQLYRVYGCAEVFRHKSGFLNQFRNSEMRSGTVTVLMELTGVQDRLNDDDVRLSIYEGADPVVKDSTGKHVVPNTSLSVSPNKVFTNHLKAKIVDGVVITEPQDIRMTGFFFGFPEFYFENARLRVKLNPDGTAAGVLGGYMNVADWWEERAHPSAEAYTKMTCNGLHYALKRYADGNPDPKTGQCQSISVAFQVEAVPAFVIHPTEVSQATP